MRLGYVILYVPDVAAALGFYEAAFGLQRRFLHESGTYGELETGTTALAFAAESLVTEGGLAFRPHGISELPAATEIGLVTEDVAAAYERAVSAGASAL
jgi:catechol 2,3-dioxygenase-like lactoylglutathione lyase family enzyme